MTVNLGTCTQATAVTSLAPCLAIPSVSYCLPTMKPVIFCRNTNGIFLWPHSSTKCAPFSSGLTEQNSIIGNDADRVTMNAGKATDQCGAVQCLEFIKFGTIHDTCDHFADIVGFPCVRRYDSVNFIGVIKRLFHFAHVQAHRFTRFKRFTARRTSFKACRSLCA